MALSYSYVFALSNEVNWSSIGESSVTIQHMLRTW